MLHLKQITLSNVPPFITEAIAKKVSSIGKLEKITMDCKALLVNHLVSHRKRVYMVLNNSAEELDLVMKFHVDCFDYDFCYYEHRNEMF